MSLLNMASLNFYWMLSEFRCHTFGLKNYDIHHISRGSLGLGDPRFVSGALKSVSGGSRLVTGGSRVSLGGFEVGLRVLRLVSGASGVGLEGFAVGLCGSAVTAGQSLELCGWFWGHYLA